MFFPGNFEDDILESTRNEADEPTCVEMLAGPSFALRARMTKFLLEPKADFFPAPDKIIFLFIKAYSL